MCTGSQNQLDRGSFQLAAPNVKEQIRYHHSNNAGDPRARKTPINTTVDIFTVVMIKKVGTCGSHPGVQSVFEPAETAGQGQGPLAIKESGGPRLLVPRGLNIYWEKLRRRFESSRALQFTHKKNQKYDVIQKVFNQRLKSL